MIKTQAELIIQFKAGKSSEWDPSEAIKLWKEMEADATEENQVEGENEDQIVEFDENSDKDEAEPTKRYVVLPTIEESARENGADPLSTQFTLVLNSFLEDLFVNNLYFDGARHLYIRTCSKANWHFKAT